MNLQANNSLLMNIHIFLPSYPAITILWVMQTLVSGNKGFHVMQAQMPLTRDLLKFHDQDIFSSLHNRKVNGLS